MKITLEMYGRTHIFESEFDDYNSDEVMEEFSKLMVCAGYSPSVIRPAEGGHFECEYKEDNE